MAVEYIPHPVFNNELLLDNIMGYVVQNGHEISSADVRSCRFVNKAFLRSASKCLYKQKKPLFHIHLDRENSVNGTTYVSRNGKLLDNFVNSLTRPDRLEANVPNFNLKIDANFFRKENFESLRNLFNQCGNSLVGLEIQLPVDGGSMIFLFPRLSLPNLQHWSVTFAGVETNDIATGERLVGTTQYVHLMNNILCGSQGLQALKLHSGMYWDRCEPDLPYFCEHLVLPPTLLSLELICCRLRGKNLELVTNNDFPNLKRFTLNRYQTCSDDDLVSLLLEKFRDTLTHFRSTKDYYHYTTVNKLPTYYELPVMKELECFENSTLRLELKTYDPMLQYKLPKLRKLSLQNHTFEMFRKWTENSTFTSVLELVLSLSEDVPPVCNPAFPESFTPELVPTIIFSFPNLQTLDITVYADETCGIKAVFQDLKLLQTLRISVDGFERVSNSDPWDALLLGIPVEVAQALRTNQSWGQVADHQNETIPSILNLTELQELDLKTIGWRSFKWENNYTFISDAAFQHAFMKMPKLTKISLAGKFLVSPEAELQWKEKGGEISFATRGLSTDMIDYLDRYGPSAFEDYFS